MLLFHFQYGLSPHFSQLFFHRLQQYRFWMYAPPRQFVLNVFALRHCNLWCAFCQRSSDAFRSMKFFLLQLCAATSGFFNTFSVYVTHPRLELFNIVKCVDSQNLTNLAHILTANFSVSYIIMYTRQLMVTTVVRCLISFVQT